MLLIHSDYDTACFNELCHVVGMRPAQAEQVLSQSNQATLLQTTRRLLASTRVGSLR